MAQSHNPVVFAHADAPGFVAYANELSEFAWKNRLVGHTNEGFLYVDERVSKGMHYEFTPKLLPWSAVHELRTRRCWSFRGLLLAAILLLMGACGVMALWTGKFKTDLRWGPLAPFFFLLGGGLFLLGVVRNEIIVSTRGATFRWRSGPLEYKATLPFCVAVRSLAESNRVAVVISHA